MLTGALVCLLGGLFALEGLELKTARIELTGDELPFARRFLALEEEFGDLNRIVVTLRARDRSEARGYAAALTARIRADSTHFAGVFDRVGPEELQGQALLLLPSQRLEESATLAEEILPGWREGPLSGTLSGWARLVETRLEGGGSSGLDADFAERGEELLADATRLCRGQDVTTTAFDLVPAWDEAGYVWGSGDRLLLLVAFREDADGQLDPRTVSVTVLRALVQELGPEWPGVEVGLTGKPVLEVDEMATYEADSIRASIVALVGVTVLLILAFRRLSAPLLLGGSLALSVAATLGLATLWPGHLNLMAVVFVMVVIGLGVDFAIHLVGRYDEARGRGVEPGAALEEALGATGPAIAAGALTTAGAFFGAACTDFKGLREFGVVAGFGVLASLLVSVTIVPGLILLMDRGSAHRSPRPQPWLRGLERWTQSRPGWVLVGCLLVSVLAGIGASRLHYEGNLLLLQDPALPSVQLEHELLADPETRSWFLAYPAASLGELAEVTSRVALLPSVDRVESVLDLCPEDAPRRIVAARRFQTALRKWLVAEHAPSRRDSLKAANQSLIRVLERALDEALAGGVKEALPVLERLLSGARGLRAAIPPGELPPALARYEERLRVALQTRARPLSLGVLKIPTPDSLPPQLRERFVGARGSYLLRIYPKGNLWDPAQLTGFMGEVEETLPEVTGVPAMLHGASSVMVDSYREAGWIALGVVSLSLLVLFRRLRPTLIALSALGVGVLWTAGLMGWLGFDLNPANLIALPLMLGIGIDSAVHVVHRASKPRAPGRALIATSLGRALIYSGLTSVASFGTLALARHPGTASMGVAISLSIAACLAAGLVVTPALWRLSAPRSGS